MKADFTRDTFLPQSARRTVRFQQGRVPLDAELNEAQDILIRRVETEARDVIGQSGAPQAQAGFEITVQGGGTELLAGAGRYYVDGILCELHAATSLTEQPDLPGYVLPADDGLYLAALDVSLDHLTALEDPRIQEVALHGADTTTRQRVKPQVRLIRVSEDPDTEATCATPFTAWDTATTAPTGALAARAEPEELPENECSMTPGAGFRSLLNQLYRVEIHDPGDETEATFKWSRENGSIVAAWQAKTGDELTVSSQGRDPQRLFRPGGWVELIDRERELRGEPGTLVRVTNVRGNVLTIDPSTASGTVDLADFETLPRVRRWESAGALGLNPDPDDDGFSPLEFGVQVRFAPGTYHSGDYWLIPARAATGDIEWEHDAATGEPRLLPRRGIEHHHARLALLRRADGLWAVVSDCRKLFPPLTDLGQAYLKLHNKHLHGSGVVCGLQVYCAGEERTAVRIRPGHAIDCEGTDILLGEEQVFGVVEQAVASELLDSSGNAEVLVTLVADAAEQPQFGVRAAPDDPSSLAAILRRIIEGTLWWDFYQDCLKPLVDSLRDLLIAPEDAPEDGLVTPQQQRLITIANLIAHRRNTPPDRRLWLSAQQHDTLRELHERLLAFAGSSKTFCAITSTFPTFPDFPFTNRPILTAFAAHQLSGVRVGPGNAPHVFAWSDDAPGRIFVYEGRSGRMTHYLALEGSAGMIVQDAVVIRPERDLLVVAVANANQTALHLLSLDTFKPAEDRIVLSGGTLTRLEAHSRQSATVLALQPGRGIHFLNLMRLASQRLPDPAWAFNAAGHLAVAEDMVCATSRVATSVPQGSYDALRFGRLTRDGNPLEDRDVRLTQIDTTAQSGSDGLVLIPSDRGLMVHVVVDPREANAPKSVLVADAANKRRIARATLPADDAQPTTGPVHLAALPNRGRVAYALTHRNQLVIAGATGAEGTLAAATLPAQAEPIALAGSGGNAPFLAVAHRAGMTMTLVPLTLLAEPAVTDAQLGAYRDAVMAAFERVLASVLQSLKDCLCDHLLLDCPECGEDAFLTLAKVEIRGRQVYHICNFDRDEVLTFPKVKYWLSAVPLIPAVSFLVDRFCCWILPTPGSNTGAGGAGAGAVAGGGLSAGAGGGAGPGVNPAVGAAGSLAANAMMTIARPGGTAKIAQMIRGNAAWAGSLGRLAFDRVAGPRAPVGPSTAPRPPRDLVGRDAPEAARDLERSGITVAAVSPYSDLVARNEPLLDIATLPGALRSGDRVELFTRDGRVAFFRRVKETPAAPTPPASGERPSTSPTTPEAGRPTTVDRDALEALRRELTEIQASHARDLATRDAEITALKRAHEETATTRTAELAEFRRSAEQDRAARDAMLTELRAANAGLTEKLAENEAALRRELESTAKTLRTEITRRTRRPSG